MEKLVKLRIRKTMNVFITFLYGKKYKTSLVSSSAPRCQLSPKDFYSPHNLSHKHSTPLAHRLISSLSCVDGGILLASTDAHRQQHLISFSCCTTAGCCLGCSAAHKQAAFQLLVLLKCNHLSNSQ